MNWAILGVFLGPNSPKYDSILLELAPEVVLKETNIVFQNFWKIQIITETAGYQIF